MSVNSKPGTACPGVGSKVSLTTGCSLTCASLAASRVSLPRGRPAAYPALVRGGAERWPASAGRHSVGPWHFAGTPWSSTVTNRRTGALVGGDARTRDPSTRTSTRSRSPEYMTEDLIVDAATGCVRPRAWCSCRCRRARRSRTGSTSTSRPHDQDRDAEIERLLALGATRPTSGRTTTAAGSCWPTPRATSSACCPAATADGGRVGLARSAGPAGETGGLGGERLLDVLAMLLRLGGRAVALDDVAVPADQELGEVPLDLVAEQAALLRLSHW